MPRRVDNEYQPKKGLGASDLGEEAYRANREHEEGLSREEAGLTLAARPVLPQWKGTRVRNRHQEDEKSGPIIKMGTDPHKG